MHEHGDIYRFLLFDVHGPLRLSRSKCLSLRMFSDQNVLFAIVKVHYVPALVNTELSKLQTYMYEFIDCRRWLCKGYFACGTGRPALALNKFAELAR